jgi:hypothetical protein
MLPYLRWSVMPTKAANMIRPQARQAELLLHAAEPLERLSPATEAELITLLGQLIQTVQRTLDEERGDEQAQR